MTDFTIVGKVKGDVEFKTTETGLEVATMFVETRRNFRSKDKDYDYDLIQLSMFKPLIDEVKDVVKNGEKLIVKGHFTANKGVNKDHSYYFCNLIADRIELVKDF